MMAAEVPTWAQLAWFSRMDFIVRYDQ